MQVCAAYKTVGGKLGVVNTTDGAANQIRSAERGEKNSSSRVRHQDDVTVTMMKDVAAIFFSV